MFKKIYPAKAIGKYNQRRTKFHLVLLLIYVLLPWLKIDGTQALWIDVLNGKIHFFGLVFFNTDLPMMFFVFASIAFLLALVTAIWGRIWCGWACPQTVFIEALYRPIERFFEGNHIEQQRLDKETLSLRKIRIKFLKHFSFLIVSLNISHPFIAYFVGTEKLFQYSLGLPEQNMFVFTSVCVLTALIHLDMVVLREIFCIYACPYGRFQSVLLDNSSLLVHYDKKRNDCINCNKCVAVCPTGIDIRNGLQMECVACTACIDACDLVMEKIKKPKSLIGYQYGEQNSLKKSILKFRSLFYFCILIILASGFLVLNNKRELYPLDITRNIGSSYQIVDDKIINSFKFNLHNSLKKPIDIKIENLESLKKKGFELQIPQNLKGLSLSNIQFSIFIVSPRSNNLEQIEIIFNINGIITKKDIKFARPH